MAETLIDRDSEAQHLRELAESGRSALALVRGRRRVGKTYLLNNLWPADRVLYYTASDTGAEINRRVLVNEAARWSGTELRAEDYPTWRALFGALLRLRPDAPIIIVIDEFQYLAEGSKGLREAASELNAVWERQPPVRSAPVLLVLSGSSLTMLKELERGGSPLYGRLDVSLTLNPFDYFDAGLMVPQYSAVDRVRAYASFGGMPAYLARIDDTRELDQNIVSQMLADTGSVRHLVRSAIEQQEGLRNVARYRAILASVGIGRPTAGEIAASIGLTRETIRQQLQHLVDISMLTASSNFGSERGIRYRLADPAERFFYGITLPLESAIAATGADQVWRELVAPQKWPTYIGQHVFEDVAAQAYRRWGPGRGLPVVPEWRRWTGRDRTRRQVDIDLVGRTLDGAVISGSVKFRSRQADARTYLEHIEALRRLADSGHGWANEALDEGAGFYFVSAGGFSDSFFEAVEPGHELICWTLDDLYPDEG
ncbi:AAA family ATPase [Candidatus Poriferisodalis sp.]|uniref:AAA family ATPase n=1 Tax=Candidatus Poriferisodalis sp. TaxID=3101277 RepID=UPI003B5213D9